MAEQIPAALVALRSRAEAVLGCPKCGRHGSLARTGGGAKSSTFRCLASDYPSRCYFRFTVTDKMLDSVKQPR
jgi:hypothetical protein